MAEVLPFDAAMTPLGRLGELAKVADAATSAEASFVIGQTIDVACDLYRT
ncbi:hypothetical protein [Falsirhodobacter sp. 20TX0035]|nr:hypothetical protein [Falsirhodobacter sp. 20TX0035]MDB6454161.1 hypothetical protein [Falsirhodobacter sp. 20TX0035]